MLSRMSTQIHYIWFYFVQWEIKEEAIRPTDIGRNFNTRYYSSSLESIWASEELLALNTLPLVESKNKQILDGDELVTLNGFNGHLTWITLYIDGISHTETLGEM